MFLRDSPEGLVEALRDAARALKDELDLDGIALEALTEWDAADRIERWAAVLERIAEGDPEAAKLARDALDDWRPSLAPYA